MVVDDDAVFSSVLRTALKEDGFEVATAPDTRAAFEVLREWSPQAVILDLNLADADGLALLVRLRAMGAVGQLPVVVLTATDDDERRARGLDLGADRYLTKPVDLELLVWHLDELLGSSRPAPVNPLVGLRQHPTIPPGLL